MTIEIRAARVEDGARLQAIERLAGERFREVGLDHVADDEPASIDELRTWVEAGRSWVAVDEDDRPVGYVIVDAVGDSAHIEQLSVRPDHQGAGVGRALIERVEAWATETGRSAVTLTTFSTVPWNGPLYAHLGFVTIPEADLSPELRAVRAVETAQGLDPTTRVCMRLDLDR